MAFSFSSFRFLVSAFLFFALPALASPQKRYQTEIEKGKYIALLSDCGACHTLEGKAEYAGGLGFVIPTGIIYATNITPDLTYGIGRYSEKDFSKAVREGIRKDGKSLYPAMPYPSYAHLSDEDIHFLYLYLRYGVAPVHQPAPKEKIRWPLNARWPLAFWRTFFAPSPKEAQAEMDKTTTDTRLKRGAYLAEGPGHCGACHTPRGLGLQERALEEQPNHLFLSGGQNMEGWDAPTLRQESLSGLKNWTAEDLENFLKTGKCAKGQVFGAMTEVVQKSTSGWKKEDLKAISAFLLSLPALHAEQTGWDAPQNPTHKEHFKFLNGKQIYIDRCAACHGPDGKGYGTAFPPLKDNPAVLAPGTASLIHIVEKGASSPAFPPMNNSSFTMPGFSDMLSDTEISDVLTYIRAAWGNAAKPVSVRTVGKLRRSLTDAQDPPVPLN